jgi:Cu+-exporting ATPase
MTTELKIEGMHCGGCAGRVERALRQAGGVRAVEVSLEAERATVEHDEQVRPAALAAALTNPATIYLTIRSVGV